VDDRPDTALILHLVPYRDADLMVSMLAAERGRVDAAAPSGRKSRNRFQAGLDKFCLVEVELATDRQGRHRLRSSRLLDPMEGLRMDLERMAAAELACEIVRATAPEGGDAGALLEPMVALLRLLTVVDPSRVGPVTWGGMVWILAAQGFMARDCRCSRCGGLPAGDEELFFSLSSGTLRCRAHALDASAMRVLPPGARLLYDAAASGNLRPLAQADARPGDLKQLSLYGELRIHEILNKTPRSLEFFHQVVG
jgi:DNA repair protein RecO